MQPAAATSEAPIRTAPGSAPMAPAGSPLNRVQKLAALLVMLRGDTAAQLLKGLDPAEVEAITAAMARLDMVPAEMQQQVLSEFSDVAVHAGSSMRGGVELTRTVLEKALGSSRATEVLSRVAVPVPIASARAIAATETRELFNVLRNEQPQTIALVVSYLPSEKAVGLMDLFAPELRDQIIERLATMGPTPVEVVDKVMEVLSRKTAAKSKALSHSGGVDRAADILNAMDKRQRHLLLLNMESRNPELMQTIRQRMFTFEDLARLDKGSLQRILREVDMRELAVALKGASETLKSCLIGSLSRRAGAALEEEMSFLGEIRRKDVETARVRIVDAARRLESEDEIDTGERLEAAI